MFYRLTNNKKFRYGIQYFQIQRVSDGQLGGWIESESNLAQDGSWIDETSYVWGDSLISGVSNINSNSIVYNQSKVRNQSKVTNSRICSNCHINKSTIYNSKLLNSTVTKSNIHYLEICNGFIEKAGIYNSEAKERKDCYSFEIKLEDNKISVNKEEVQVVCETFNEKAWLKNIVEIVKKHGCFEDEIELYQSVLKILVNKEKKELTS